jgi:hypothetical protein
MKKSWSPLTPNPLSPKERGGIIGQWSFPLSFPKRGAGGELFYKNMTERKENS